MNQNLPEYSQPSPCNLPRGTISKLGEDVSQNLHYEPGADLERIVGDLGGEISYQNFFDLDLSTSGSITVEGEGDFHIYLATHTSQSRDRFTIGHELGHYILHFVYPRQQGNTDIQRMRAARYGTGLAEYEANWFAAAFLMPEEVFKEEHKKFGGSIFRLSERFGVSHQACEVRAKSLQL